MPERPDLAHVIPKLDAALAGRRIVGVDVCTPVLLRQGVPGEPAEPLVDRVVTGVRRHLHFVVLDLDPGDVTVAIHPMLAGRFTLSAPGTRRRKALGWVLQLDAGPELRYRDDKQMGKVYVMPTDGLEQIPGWHPAGLDVLDPEAFTPEALRALLRRRRDQIKLVLLDKSAIDAFGNAYADEALHRAGIHPKRRGRELDADEVGRLHAAMVETLREATAEVARRDPPLDEKVRDFLRVRNRKGEACPTCGDTVRTVGVRGHDAFFCPTCQPDPKARGFVSWRRPPGGSGG